MSSIANQIAAFAIYFISFYYIYIYIIYYNYYIYIYIYNIGIYIYIYVCMLVNMFISGYANMVVMSLVTELILWPSHQSDCLPPLWSRSSLNPVFGHLITHGKSWSTLCWNSWVFSWFSGFLPQGSGQGGLG